MKTAEIARNTIHSNQQKGNQYGFRFVFRRPHGSVMSALWDKPKACHIEKLFDNGTSIDVGSAGDNPYPVSQDDFIAKAGKYDWVIDNGLKLDWAV